MREHLVSLYLVLKKGHQTMSDEGLSKSRMLPKDIEAYNEQHGWPLRIDLGVTSLESRAGQYMRRLRRLERRE